MEGTDRRWSCYDEVFYKFACLPWLGSFNDVVAKANILKLKMRSDIYSWLLVERVCKPGVWNKNQ